MKQVLRQEHGSVTSSPFRNYDKPINQPSKQPTNQPTDRLTDRRAHRQDALQIR